MNNNYPDMGSSADELSMQQLKEHAKTIYVPVLRDFTEILSSDPSVILLATGTDMVEQFVIGGHVEDGDAEHKIDQAVSDTEHYLITNGFINAEDACFFYKDYYNGYFNFKIYVTDMVYPPEKGNCMVRQFSAFFVDPKLKDLYHISLSAGPFQMPVDMITLGEVDLQNDVISKMLDDLLTVILDNTKYRKP